MRTWHTRGLRVIENLEHSRETTLKPSSQSSKDHATTQRKHGQAYVDFEMENDHALKAHRL